MSRTDLKVPYGEKDEAKLLGARWDPATKTWYVPPGKQLDPFMKWLPFAPDIGIRCDKYFVAQTATKCWRCGDATRVMGIVLPSGHETLESDDNGSAWWIRQFEPCFVFYITELAAPVATHVSRISPNYRVDFSKTTSSSYLMNHCEHCNMKQGDFAMYCEPGGAFFPTSQESARDIRLHIVEEPFGCHGEASYGDHLFSLTKRTRNEASQPLSVVVQQSATSSLPAIGVTALRSFKRWFRRLL